MSVNWTNVKINDIATLRGGGTPSRAEKSYFGGKLPWVTPSDLPAAGNVKVLGDVAEGLTESGLNNSSAKVVPTNSVLFSSRASIGKICVTDRTCATNQGFINLTPNNEKVTPWFLAYLLSYHTKNLIGLAGKTTFPEISRKKFGAYEVAVPSLEEQNKIVALIQECFLKVDEIDALRSQAVQDASKIEFSLFHDALIDGVRDQGWPIFCLGDVILSSRYGTSKKAHSEQIGVPVLRMGNIQNGYLDFSDLKYVDLPSNELEKYRLEHGDILVNRTNSLELVGKAATFFGSDEDWVYASYLVRIKVDNSKALPEFVTAVLNSKMGRDFVLKTARRAIGMVNINAQEMKRFPLPLPPIEEQRRIVQLLEEARPRANELRDHLQSEDVSFLKTSILQKAFSGAI